MQALEVKIKGIVQGVGFRPFIHRLVRRHNLCGTIRNTSSGVTMELEGEQGEISAFLQELPHEAPPLAVIEEILSRELPVKGFETFTIIGSERQAAGGAKHPHLTGYLDLRRLPAGTPGSCRPAISLPVYQLHQLRTALHHHRGCAV